MKIIVSGGGTGGHIFPAISIANELKAKMPDSEILFVGALGRMEMEKVPAAGYKIIGLPVMGFPRKPSLSIFKFFVNLLKSSRMAKKVVRDFKPDVAVGVGGYASGPTLRAAAKSGVPTVLQEQNSYAGLTNKMLAKKATKICVAYDDMNRFFPAEKITFTGNPVRKDLVTNADKRDEALAFYNVAAGKKVILVTGGSLGARTLNDGMIANIEKLANADVEVIWQTGKFYYKQVCEKLTSIKCPNVHVVEFLSRMDLAYSIADIVVARAGASTISELCLMGKPSILIPSPNVAEDHQTKNAMALVNKDAAIMVKDVEAVQCLVDKALLTIANDEMLKRMSENIKTLAKPNAASDIADIIIKLSKNK